MRRVRAQLDTIAGMLGRQFPKVEAMLRDTADDITAFADFPAANWKKIWSTTGTRHREDTHATTYTTRRDVTSYLESSLRLSRCAR